MAALNHFRPHYLNAYPSAAMRLAEQEAGRLGIAPRHVYDELASCARLAMTDRLAETFGVAPFDVYATTEGLFGAECERHDGIHLFDDVCGRERRRGRPPGAARRRRARACS